MNTGNAVVDRNLARAASKWRGLLFLRRASLIGAAMCFGFMLLALAMVEGWVLEPSTAGGWVGALIFFGLLFVCGAAIGALGRQADAGRIAAALERGQPALQDRVNALVSLQPQLRRRRLSAFYKRIAAQAQRMLAGPPAPISFPSLKAGRHLAALALAVAATVAVYLHLSPWQRMMAARQARLAAARAAAPAPAEPALELAAPAEVAPEKKAWGEVRITDPARDLQATKVDVVPLQIEAVASDALQRVAWLSAINAQQEQSHDLPPPPEPRYAAYRPTLYLDELKLSDWDVLSYYASASARPSNSFASEVYFIEVRPFREDILKMPGGEDGQAMQCLNELSALIGQQQHVIRQTHQHAQSPPEFDNVREQDRRKLTEAEADLARASGHLYARMAAEMENKPIGEALDHLARAEKDLDKAAGALRDNALPEAQKQERGGLANLVAARKAFQKAVSDNPGQFKDEPEEGSTAPDAGRDALKEIAEYRDASRAAQDLLQKLLAEQRQLAERTRLTNNAGRNNYPTYGAQQRQARERLEEFRGQHPQVFKPVAPQADAAQHSMESAAKSLEKRELSASRQVQDAASKLEQLAESMKEKSAEKSLADTYKLKEKLDQQIRKMGQCQNPGESGAPSGAEVKSTVAETRQTLKALKQAAEEPPTSEEFGPELRQSLDQGSMMSLNWSLGELEQAGSPEDRKRPAGEAKSGLEKVSSAFERSEPRAMQAARKAAREGWQGDFERGMDQIESLIQQMQKSRPLSGKDQAKLAREALQNLQGAQARKGGWNEAGNQALERLRQQLERGEEPVDVELLKSVRDALLAYSIELRSRQESQSETQQMSGLDPSRLPSAYRGRIQKYFEKLSEK